MSGAAAALARVGSQLARGVAQQEGRLAGRSFSSSAGPRAHYDYEHGPNYLDFQNWPGRQRKVATWIIGIITTGIGVPALAVIWHQRKAAGA